MTIQEALASASETLADAGVPEPRREAGSLLELCIERPRAFIFAHPEYELSAAEFARYNEYVSRRSGGEPFHYIAGTREFYGLDLIVSPDVLIPRPETEMAVEAAIEFLRPLEQPEFLEIGIGSGCISVSVLFNVPEARAAAVDISPEALAVAEKNALRHGVGERIEMRVSDVYSNVPARQFGLIVTNPPYVPAADIAGLQSEVRGHEPLVALTDGGTGLSIIERIVRGAPEYLRPGGILLIEIGFAQAAAVAEMFDGRIWADTEIIPDVRSIPRLARSRLR